MSLKKNKKIYFVSDFHLGVDARLSSKEREIIICDWLDSIQDHASHIYMLGDIFDYWFEYKSSIPKGFSRFMSTLRKMRDEGIEISFFTGNHDMWMFNYFTDEYGIPVYHTHQTIDLDGKKFLIGHGDGLGPGDHLYKVVKRVFRNPFLQKCFSLIHPTLALYLMRVISQRDAHKYSKPHEFNEDSEALIQFAKNHSEPIDYFIFGHRHIAYDISLDEGNRILNLGDWISYHTYAVWDGESLELAQYGDFVKSIYVR